MKSATSSTGGMQGVLTLLGGAGEGPLVNLLRGGAKGPLELIPPQQLHQPLLSP